MRGCARPGAWLYAVTLVSGGLALSLLAARALYAITERFYFSERGR